MTLSDSEVDRLRGLANVGAAAAAVVLSQLLDRPVLADPPRLQRRGRTAAPGPQGATMLFHAEGSISGMIGLFLAPTARADVLRCLLGDRVAEDYNTRAAASALCELGNIVVSQTVSAIANVLGERILLSVPKLVVDDPDAALGELASTRSGATGVWLASEIVDREKTFAARLIFAVDRT
jgi:chemotaxis protein CheC